jgi:hypothetical protein
MYMNRTQHLPRPSAQEQQPECRRPMEEEKSKHLPGEMPLFD